MTDRRLGDEDEGYRAVEEPLARKLAFQSVVAALVLGLLVALLQIGLDLRGEMSRFELTLQNLLKVATPTAARAVYTLDRASAREVLAGLFAYDFVIEARILDEKENVLASRVKEDSISARSTYLSDWLSGGVAEHRVALRDPNRVQPYTGELFLRADRGIALSSFANRAFLTITFGLARNIALALILIWIYSRFLARPIEAFIRALADVEIAKPQNTVLPDLQGHRKDELGLLSATIQRLLNSSGTHIQLLRQAERTLSESEQRFRAFIEASPLPISLKTPEGKIILANRQFEVFYDLEPGEAIGKSMRSFVPSDRALTSETTDREIIESGSVLQFEVSWVQPDGLVCEVMMTKFPIRDNEGQVAMIGSFFVDVTKLKDAERQLHQSQKMQAIGQLTGGVAHDFNNILAIMIGNLELIAESLQDDEARQRLLETAIRAGERGAQLTQQLLAFSRRQVLSPGPVDARALVSNLMGLVRRTVDVGIEIEVTSAEDLWTCEADPVQMENAVLNLVLNARDAMPNGGKLTVDTANACLDEAYCAGREDLEPGEYVVIAVRDQGCGLPASIRPKIFEPFFTTKPIGAGTGLGLSMVFGFIKQSKGHISVDSQEGEGTTFRIYLPRSEREEVPAISAPPPGEYRGRGEKILVVEDDKDMRDLSVGLLCALGYEVMSTADGSSALEVLESEAGIDLLLTDLVLPGSMNGSVLAERASVLRRDLRVLFMSGYPESTLAREEGLDRPVTLLHKPFKKLELARQLRLALEGPAS